MARSSPKSPTDKKCQKDRFIETARALGCDEDEAAFDEKLKVIARQKSKGDTVKAPAKLKSK